MLTSINFSSAACNTMQSNYSLIKPSACYEGSLDSYDLILINSPLRDYRLHRRIVHRVNPPIGLGLLATTCKEKGIRVGLLDAEYHGLAVEEIAYIIHNNKPKFIGINLLSPTYQLSCQLIAKISQNSMSKVIVGGPHATLRARDVMSQNPGIYALIKGESEFLLPDLIINGPRDNRIILQSNINDCDNIGENIIEELDSLPFIDREYFVDDPRPFGTGYEVCIHTSRGCPFSCIYCAVPSIFGHKVRRRSVSNVFDEIESLIRKYNITRVHFIDDNFLLEKNWTSDFIEEYEHRKGVFTWSALARADTVINHGEEMIRWLSICGCRELVFGFETGSSRILSYIHKGYSLQQAINAISLCNDWGIRTKGFFMLGFPSETEEEMDETIQFAQRCGLNKAYFVPVRALPGTPFFESLIGGGLTEKELLEYYQITDLIEDADLMVRMIERGMNPNDIIKFSVMQKEPIGLLDRNKLIKKIVEAYEKFYSNQMLDSK